MNKGVLLFAHNSRDIDYSLLSLLSGGLAKKNLNVPVSLVSDVSTVTWMKSSGIYDKALSVFDQIILTDIVPQNNKRLLYDGIDSKIVPFINGNRSSAWELTPYDKTLLIDADYLIFTDLLNEFWNTDQDILISSAINDVSPESRIGYNDRYISNTGIHLLWATTVMFTKNDNTKLFFELVKSIKKNYNIYGEMFQFKTNQYRNDIAFSVAKHILDGFETNLVGALPPVLTALDKDLLHDVIDDKLLFLINDKSNLNFYAAAFKNIDLHIMNKQSIIRNSEKILKLL
jgi:hypothetical protein